MSQTIQFKTPKGHVEELVVGELLAVDGQPIFEETSEDFVKLKGRVEALEQRLDRLIVSAYEPEILNAT